MPICAALAGVRPRYLERKSVPLIKMNTSRKDVPEVGHPLIFGDQRLGNRRHRAATGRCILSLCGRQPVMHFQEASDTAATLAVRYEGPLTDGAVAWDVGCRSRGNWLRVRGRRVKRVRKHLVKDSVLEDVQSARRYSWQSCFVLGDSQVHRLRKIVVGNGEARIGHRATARAGTLSQK